jgi:hypothetical protein
MEVLDEQLQVPLEHAYVLELDAPAHRHVHVPLVLLARLQVHRRHRPHVAGRNRPRAAELHSALHGPRLEALGLLVEQVPAPAVDPQAPRQIVGELEVHALVGEIDALEARAEQQLVAQVRALVEDAPERENGPRRHVPNSEAK